MKFKPRLSILLTDYNFIKNFPVVIHQLFFFFAQLIILYIYGIGYSGSLAYIGAVSTILAVLINLKWDIQIMVSNNQTLSESLLDASLTIFIMTIIISILNILVGSLLPIYILLSALAIGIHELLVSILFVQKKIIIYSLYRTIPALALVGFALIGYEPEFIWPASFFLSVIFLVIYFKNLFIKAFDNINISRIKNIKLITNINAAITATIFAFFSASFVIIINHFYGSDYVGLWANTIRIFNSVIIFLLAASLPFMLNMLKGKEFVYQKVRIFFYLWCLFLPLVVMSFFVVTNLGLFVFSLFQPINLDITNFHLSLIFLIGVSISFIGSAQGLYQAINKSIILLAMIIITILFGLIIINKISLSFTSLIEVFLFVVAALVLMTLAHLINYLIFKTR